MYFLPTTDLNLVAERSESDEHAFPREIHHGCAVGTFAGTPFWDSAGSVHWM